LMGDGGLVSLGKPFVVRQFDQNLKGYPSFAKAS